MMLLNIRFLFTVVTRYRFQEFQKANLLDVK